jgi:16S rRNA (guanine527-N7)-methyltransferase
MSKEEQISITYQKHQDSFDHLLKLYQEYNSHTNISAIRADADIIDKHFKDSLAAVPLLKKLAEYGSDIYDLGAGGGFPTLPLAIALPKYEFTAIDSVGKKLKFVHEAASALALTNVSTVTARAEELSRNLPYEGGAAILMSRAMAYLPMLLELSARFVEPQGHILAFKQATDNGEEVKAAAFAAKTLGFKLVEQYQYHPEKQILVYKQFGKLGYKYPRNFGLIKSKPLLAK